MNRPLAVLCVIIALLPTLPARADAALDSLAREVDRVESIRAVKTLESSFSQYAQYGLWNPIGSLFAEHGSFVFDGMVKPAETAQGPRAVAAFLRKRYGGDREGVAANGLSTLLIESPVVNLSVDGNTAKARWQALFFHGHGSAARIEGGVFENDYAREKGVWKIAKARYFPQYDGPYEDGWTNWGGGDLPVVPKHFDTETAGVPIPPATGTAPVTKATLASIQSRVDRLNDEDRIRNLQSAYGYYADRKMWSDVVDLFAADGVVEVGGLGIWRGPASIRRWLETMGPAGLKHGQLHDRGHNDVTVTLSPGGNEAFARGIEFGMLGEADEEKGWWEVAAFHTRFVKEGGVWKIRELRRFPQMKTDVFQGWGKNRITDPVPTPPNAPDAPASDPISPALAVPAFIAAHPVTGRSIGAAGNGKLVATRPLTGAIPRGKAAPITLDEARRRLARSAAYDGIANVTAAYGFYIDDSDAAGWAGLLAKNGYKETPFQGYHIGRDRLIKARVKGKGPEKQAGISYHWTTQPVVLVSDDARSATGRFRLFQPRTGKTVGKEGDFFAAQFWGGMYHDRYVLEDGIWRLWELTLDEPYIVPVAWKDGVWAKAKDPAKPRTFGTGVADIDVPIKSLGRREQNFWGGTGEQLQWPSILPMWFTYTNPVTGRVPEFHHPDCVPCVIRPDLRLEKHGYQEPPDAPAVNRAP
jgi:hypothetical protein